MLITTKLSLRSNFGSVPLTVQELCTFIKTLCMAKTIYLYWYLVNKKFLRHEYENSITQYSLLRCSSFPNIMKL